MKTILSKVLTVSSKFQITVPQHVRELMNIQQNDEVVFTTDGKNVFFEKVQRANMYDKLITFARHILQIEKIIKEFRAVMLIDSVETLRVVKERYR